MLLVNSVVVFDAASVPLELLGKRVVVFGGGDGAEAVVQLELFVRDLVAELEETFGRREDCAWTLTCPDRR